MQRDIAVDTVVTLANDLWNDLVNRATEYDWNKVKGTVGMRQLVDQWATDWIKRHTQ
jgi:hypothetical protein